MNKKNKKRQIQIRRNKVKTQKQLKKSRSSKSKKLSGPVFTSMPNPFDNLDDEKRKELIQNIGENAEKSYQESLSTILNLLHNYDPKVMLSLMVSYGLVVGVGDKGIQSKDMESKFHQAHVEVFQCLALTVNSDKIGEEICGPKEFQELYDSLITLLNSQSFRTFAQSIKDENEEEKSLRFLQETMRSNTQTVRNWGYKFQVSLISKEIYSYFDEELKMKFGYTATDVINMYQLLIDEINIFNSDRYKLLSKLYKMKNKEELLSKYNELLSKLSEDESYFTKDINAESMSFKSLFKIFVSINDIFVNKGYEFSPADLSMKLGLDELTIKKLLDEFSYKWGDLESYEIEHIYLSNPVWLRSIIKLSDSKYFCVWPPIFFSFIFQSMDRILEQTDDFNISKRRSTYLEEKIEEIILRKFPKSNTIPKVEWNYHDVEYETDLITSIDSHIIIVEAKSGKITPSALRGAPGRLKKHIEEILIAPNIQSKRLKEKLEGLIANPDLDDPLRKKLPFDLNKIHKIIRISISLENFASIQTNVAEYSKLGWLPDNFDPCPTMTLADFETLFDFLDHPVQIIHYLQRRQELEGKFTYMGDELDMMGLYIGTLLNLGDIDENNGLAISGMSSPLDDYYNSKSEGIEIPKPKPEINSLFSGIFEQLEKRQTPRWTEIGVILNRFSPGDQQTVKKMLKPLKKTVEKSWGKTGHKNMIICTPPKASKYALCYVMYNNRNKNQRLDFIEDAAKSGLEADHVEQCIVIAKNIDDNEVEYSSIGLYK